MPYLNLDLDYFTHPKVLRLVGIIGAPYICMPIKLWMHVAKHHPEDGVLVGYSKQELESILGWTHACGMLVDAFVKIGFLEIYREGYRVHDWLEHAGHLSAFKKRAKTAAKSRWKKYATSNRKGKATNAPNHLNQSSPILTSSSEEVLPLQTSESVKTPDLKSMKRAKPEPRSAAVWEAYALAYVSRYGASPVRNAGVNAMLGKLVEKLGKESAPAVAAFYVRHNQPFYVAKRHPVTLLLNDAEGLHTQWVTGVKATTSEGKAAEQRDDAVEQINRVRAAMEGRA